MPQETHLPAGCHLLEGFLSLAGSTTLDTDVMSGASDAGPRHDENKSLISRSDRCIAKAG